MYYLAHTLQRLMYFERKYASTNGIRGLPREQIKSMISDLCKSASQEWDWVSAVSFPHKLLDFKFYSFDFGMFKLNCG